QPTIRRRSSLASVMMLVATWIAALQAYMVTTAATGSATARAVAIARPTPTAAANRAPIGTMPGSRKNTPPTPASHGASKPTPIDAERAPEMNPSAAITSGGRAAARASKEVTAMGRPAARKEAERRPIADDYGRLR